MKIVAVAIISQAVLGMAKTLTPDRQRASIAAAAAAAVLLLGGSIRQIVAIVLGAVAEYLFCRSDNAPTSGALQFPVRRRAGIASLVLFAALLFGGPLLVLATGSGDVAQFDAFYRAGSLVLGGGHVVLPLLHGSLRSRSFWAPVGRMSLCLATDRLET